MIPNEWLSLDGYDTIEIDKNELDVFVFLTIILALTLND